MENAKNHSAPGTDKCESKSCCQDQSEAQDTRDQERAKVYTEDIKQDHTTHWDLDYLPKEQVDEAYDQDSAGTKDGDKPQD